MIKNKKFVGVLCFFINGRNLQHNSLTQSWIQYVSVIHHLQPSFFSFINVINDIFQDNQCNLKRDLCIDVV